MAEKIRQLPASFQENRVVLHDSRTRTWLDFREPHRIISTGEPSRVLACLTEIEQLVECNGWAAAGMVSYEAGRGLDEALVTHEDDGFPLLWFGLYDPPQSMDLPLPANSLGQLPWAETVTEAQYIAAIERIHRYIEAGDCYQVNYTYRNRSPFQGDLWETFLQLIAAQNPLYGGFARTADWAILSSSPELFFLLDGTRIESLPMKGTIGRGPTLETDRRRERQLRNSIKDQAENVMIVDMVRNDLARIAEPGSVRVEELFTLQRFPTLWQMISRVSAHTGAGLADLFRALFPAASITGAPKARTMEIIRELEPTPRRLYTGSLGYLLPGRIAQFNVAIRTMLVDLRSNEAEYGVGGGITYDSTALGELEEARVKAKICKPRPPSFSLLETLRWTPAQGYWLLDEHLDRLTASADYFDYPASREELQSRLTAVGNELADTPHKVRLLLDRRGGIRIEAVPLALDDNDRLRRVILTTRPVDSSNVFLYHKTTHRTLYQEHLRGLPTDIDDVILFNERGEVTETTIANIVIHRDGRDLTPPVRCGLLGGTLRRHLLDRGELVEAVVTVDDLLAAESMSLINSVRGRYPARLHIGPAPGK